MKFYNIKEDYILFLSKYDSKVLTNKSAKRPYVGTVIEIGNIKYYAPFTSPKPKHTKMKNGKDFRKINHGKYGAINFNNMIPVPNDALIIIVFSNISDPKYKQLLKNQYQAIIADRNSIVRTASNLRTLIFSDDNNLSKHDKEIKSRCCNLPLLESIYTQYDSGIL